ncbi:MAG: class I SAM-dependent methyltransferase [Chloroflexi bacterium]|nr:class I SAM-dependent methyltransferase [Chloroflexota bacterium]
MEEIACNVCQSDNYVVLYEGRDRLHGLGGPFRLVKCQQCGLIYLNPRPTREEMGQYYPPDYEPYAQDIEQAKSFLSGLDYRYGVAKRCRMITKRKGPGRILDVGCGVGHFLSGMRQRGWQAFGTEISERAAAYARERFGLEVLVGELEEAKFPAAYFDAVTLWHVLEHLHDPLATLVELFRLLKDDGLLVFSIPNWDSVDAKLFGEFWVGLDMPRHLYTFPRPALEKLLAKTGFKIAEEGCFFGSHGSFVLSLQFLLEEKMSQRSLRRFLLWLSYTKLARLMASPYFYLVDRLGAGPIIAMTCIKRENMDWQD